MKVFGMKRTEPTDEDRAAAARLSAVAARFKGASPTDLTESSPDPLGEPEATDEAAAEPEAASEWQAAGIEQASEEPEAAEDPQDPDGEE
jgi:hypothetical protein